MLRVRDLTEFLGTFAPLSIAESWDNVGLIVGDCDLPVVRVMTCLTVTPDVVEEALQKQINLIVTHHPLLFKPVQKLVSTDSQGQMLLQLIAGRIAVYSPHTAFDNAAQGINQHWATCFQLSNIAPLRSASSTGSRAPVPAPDGGAGRYGDLATGIPLKEFCLRAKSLLSVATLQVVGDADRLIRRIGIACGAAAEFIPDAVRVSCDLLLTGEARFHDCLRARDAGLALILPGHYASERAGIEFLAAVLQSQFPTLQVLASAVESDPIQFV